MKPYILITLSLGSYTFLIPGNYAKNFIKTYQITTISFNSFT